MIKRQDLIHPRAPTQRDLALGVYDRQKARQFFPRTQAEALAWSGVTWDYGFGGFDVSGSSSLWGGLGDMVVSGAAPSPAGSRFPGMSTAESPLGGSSRWVCPANSDLDAGASEFALIAILDVVEYNTGQRIMNKMSYGPSLGWQLLSGTTLQINMVDDLGQFFAATINASHVGIGPFPVFVHWAPGGTLDVATHRGSASVSAAGMGNPGNLTQPFRLPGTGNSTPRQRPYFIAASVGANAAGIDGANLINRIWRGP